MISPDTGRTIKSYDSAGNLKTTIDARGALATYTYDALNPYVLTAAQEVGAPTYCAIASAEFGLSGLAAEAAGARNCQSWARDVIAKAKQNYLAHENCPTCFKK